jgi:HEAT repeat protein
VAVVIAIAAIALGSFGVWYYAQGPRYQGRTVPQWIAGAGRGEDFQTNEAIRAMLATLGTNAIPPLLETLESKDTMLEKACRRISAMNGLPKSIRASASARLDRNQQLAVAAAGTIRLLWTNAEPAIPNLERLAQDTNGPLGGIAALWALTGLGKATDPAMARLKSNAPPSRAVLIKTLMERSRTALLRSSDPSQREDAALGLSWSWLSWSNAESAIPILEGMSESHDAEKREAATQALSRLARTHAAARNALRRATNGDYADTRRIAMETLDRLDGLRKLKTFD